MSFMTIQIWLFYARSNTLDGNKVVISCISDQMINVLFLQAPIISLPAPAILFIRYSAVMFFRLLFLETVWVSVKRLYK